MILRIFIFRPSAEVGEALARHIESLGHEVAVIRFPQSCLRDHSAGQPCSRQEFCADAIMVGDAGPVSEGLAMLEKRIAARCGGAIHNAVICHPLSEAEQRQAVEIGCRIFSHPLQLSDVSEWLQQVAAKIDPQRELASFTIGGPGHMTGSVCSETEEVS